VWNDVTYLEQKVPSLFTAISTGQDAISPQVYGVNANAQVLGYGNVIELVINNFDSGAHPIHIHGHAPQQLYRSSSGFYKPGEPLPPSPYPMRRDTWLVNPGGHTVSRFVADNPGVWFVHCHMDWHLVGGLAFTLVEAPLQLQASQTIPQEALALCEAQGTSTAGNAAGNTKNHFDLRGAVTTPNPSPSG
jgi:iron transport multicopper oxidase